MPRSHPPADCPGLLVGSLVPTGTTFWRVHSEDRDANAFNPIPRPATAAGTVVEGGRFDSLDGSYAYLYAAGSVEGAFAESFARNLDYTRSGPRPLPFSRIAKKIVSEITVSRDVNLVKCFADGAEQIGQDTWLTTCDEGDYPVTREWAASVRRWWAGADGLAWKSRREPAVDVMVLWCDTAAAAYGCGIVAVDSGAQALKLAHGPGRYALEQWLAKWRLYIEP